MRSRLTFAGLVVAGLLAMVTGCRLDWNLEPLPPKEPPAPDGGGPDATFSCDGALLCSTFDEGGIVPPWAQTFVSAGGGLLRVEAAEGAPSGPNALFAFRPTETAPPSTAYAQSPTFEQALTHTSLAFQVRPEQVDPGSHACIAGINFDEGLAGEHTVRIMMGGATAFVQDRTPNKPVTGIPLRTIAAKDRWSAITLSVDIKGSIVVSIDGVTVLDTPLDPSWSASRTVRAFIGINFTESPSKPFGFHFDDVRFEGR